jgi:hypothetical protein
MVIFAPPHVVGARRAASPAFLLSMRLCCFAREHQYAQNALVGVDGKPSVRGLNHSDRRTDAAFIRIDAFWSLLGALSQLQKRGSDCAVKKMTQA